MATEDAAFKKIVFGMKRDIAYEPDDADGMLTWMVVSLTKDERVAARRYIQTILSKPNAGQQAMEAWNACRDADILIYGEDGAERLFRELDRRLGELADARTF